LFTCKFCGFGNDSPLANICIHCGPQVNWDEDEVDLPNAIHNYVDSLSDLYFAPDVDEDIALNESRRIRQRLKISYSVEKVLLDYLSIEKKLVSSLMEFNLYFDSNVVDAYAGNDTYLKFKVSNLSKIESYKVALHWIDPQSPTEQLLDIKTSKFLRPGSQNIIGGTYVFSRMGPKEIPDMKVTVTNSLRDTVTFMLSPLRFKVGNPEQKVTQNFATHIEGRVVTADNMSINSVVTKDSAVEQWVELEISYLFTKKAEIIELVNQQIFKSKTTPQEEPPVVPSQVSQKTVDEVEIEADGEEEVLVMREDEPLKFAFPSNLDPRTTAIRDFYKILSEIAKLLKGPTLTNIFLATNPDGSNDFSVNLADELTNHPFADDLIAICTTPGNRKTDEFGKLEGWGRRATLICKDGLRSISSSEQLDGPHEEKTVNWTEFFFRYKPSLMIRHEIPDLWIGDRDHYYFPGCYFDFSENIDKWIVFDETLRQKVFKSFNEFKTKLGVN